MTATLTGAGIVPVYNTNDAFAGSLRQAIQDAAPGDTIIFQIPANGPGYDFGTNTYTIGLTSAELVINKNLTIEAGNSRIVVQRNSGIFRVFNVTAGVVLFSNLTIANGYTSSNSSGGNIFNSGDLTVRGCTIRDGACPGLAQSGGGVRNAGTLTVINSTITNNDAFDGAGIYNNGGAVLTVRDSTIVGNRHGSFNTAAGVANSGTARIGNTIIVGNTVSSPPRDVSGSFISEGYNLVGDSSHASGFTTTGDQVGIGIAQVNLSPLQDNGGPTQTMRPRSPSPAIDQGKRGADTSSQPINTDQRGQSRPIDLATPNAVGGDGSDIGAVETGLAQNGPDFTVTNAAEHDDGICTTDDCTLLEALKAANANADANTINFAPGVSGAITTLITPNGLVITNPVTINGPGARILQISGGNAVRVFQSSANVSMSGLTVTGGYVADNGAGIFVNAGVLTLTDCSVSYNSAASSTSNGGGIYLNSGATLNLVRTLVRQNYAGQFGGGIYSDGAVNATNCSFFNNVALRGGAIISRFNNGASSVTLRNCTITHNTSTSTGTATGDGGGGFYAEGGAPQYHLGNTLIAANVSQSSPATNPDIRGNFTSDGHNFIGTIGFSNLTSGSGDQVGSNNFPRDARLASFGTNNGGPTDTWALLNDSPAINAGDNALAPSTDQRSYTRSGVSDIGAFEVGGIPPLIHALSAVSRKTHGGSGTFDFTLPLTGPAGVECRTGGAGGNHQVIVTFASAVSVGGLSIMSSDGLTTATQGVSGTEVTINLSTVANAQTLGITLIGVSDGTSAGDVVVPIGVLLGDSNGNGFVNSGDAVQTRGRAGQATDNMNFRSDVNADGFVNSGDTTLMRARSGTSLP